MRRLLGICLSSLVLLLAGCGTLPAREPLPATQALAPAEVATTTLARIAAASTPAEAQGLSGFRLLPTGEYAFEARAALAGAAQRSIDAQYFHVHDDAAGVAFLRSLRDAARRGVRVRLLVDDYHAGEVFNLLIALNAEPGAEVRLFNPLLIRSGAPLPTSSTWTCWPSARWCRRWRSPSMRTGTANCPGGRTSFRVQGAVRPTSNACSSGAPPSCRWR